MSAGHLPPLAPAPAPQPMPFPVNTMENLQHAVLFHEDAPGRVTPGDLKQIVGITAKRIGFAALGKADGVTIDLGNGYALTSKVHKLPEAS